MFSEAVGLLEQVGFKPSPKLSGWACSPWVAHWACADTGAVNIPQHNSWILLSFKKKMI